MRTSSKLETISDYIAAKLLISEYMEGGRKNFIQYNEDGVSELCQMTSDYISKMSTDLTLLFGEKGCEELASNIFGILTGEKTEQQMYLEMLYDALDLAGIPF